MLHRTGSWYDYSVLIPRDVRASACFMMTVYERDESGICMKETILHT